jgi:hypothetical protein
MGSQRWQESSPPNISGPVFVLSTKLWRRRKACCKILLFLSVPVALRPGSISVVNQSIRSIRLVVYRFNGRLGTPIRVSECSHADSKAPRLFNGLDLSGSLRARFVRLRSNTVAGVSSRTSALGCNGVLSMISKGRLGTHVCAIFNGAHLELTSLLWLLVLKMVHRRHQSHCEDY